MAFFSRKMTIGVSGLSERSKSVRAMMKQIRDEGGQAIFLAHRSHRPHLATKKDLGRIDALVIMGNDLDIDPKRYIHRYRENDPKRAIHYETRNETATLKGAARARYEEAAIKKALECGLPLLGVCGGMQRINVLCGGTLHQHIPDLVGCDKHMQHKQGIAPRRASIPIIIKENTRLCEIACEVKMPFAGARSSKEAKVIMENSMHHQAMDKIGDGFRVCAMTDTVKLKDGCAGYLAEAIETDPYGP